MNISASPCKIANDIQKRNCAIRHVDKLIENLLLKPAQEQANPIEADSALVFASVDSRALLQSR